MTTGSKRWWRAVAVAAVTGGVIGGWFGLARPQPAKADKSHDETAWTRSTAVTDVARAPEAAPPTDAVTPVGGTLPIPVPGVSGPVVPAIPGSQPILVPAAPLFVPSPGLPVIEPVAGPRVSDAGFLSTDKTPLPVVPALPPAELPPLPAPPKTPEVKPVVSSPAVPPMPVAPTPPAVPPLPFVPMNTAEPPKAAPFPPTPPAGMAMPPVAPTAPPTPVLPRPAEIAPSLSPVTPVDPVQPMLPAKPNSDLKPSDPPITLNPTVAPAVPITPVVPGASGRDTPGTVVDRPKPPEPNFGTTDKFVFPIPVKPPAPDPLVPHQRDDTMFKLTTTAAFAVLGGAMLAGEKAGAFPAVPPSAAIPTPGMLVKADDKTDVENLKKDLTTANKKIEELEKQVKLLTDLLTGKRNPVGELVNPNDPGAVAQVTKLKDDIYKLETELKSLKTQTALKPLVAAPEVKPKGIVEIINEYPVEITMMINDKAPTYRVAPNTTLKVEVPAGEFTYQLLQSGAPATRSIIKDKEVVKLRIK